MTLSALNNSTTTLSGNNDNDIVGNCGGNGPGVTYNSSIGFTLSMPEYEAIGTALLLSLITLITIVGNVLVILSVFTYKPLRIVQNFFIVSLAVADLTVAILVLPLNVAYYIRGRWDFGIHVCKMWLTSDVMCCTASILHLCVIALDRYWAITDPINYAQKRNVERVLILIAGVWILSFVISSPPLLGWNDWPSDFHSNTPCELTSERGYVIYSALGSFFLPLVIMTIVYIEIFVATRRRLRERAQAATKMNALMKNQVSNAAVTKMTVATVATTGEPTTHQHQNNSGGSGETRGERESISSEVNHNETSAMVTNEEQKSSSKIVDSSKAFLKKLKFVKRKTKRKAVKHDIDDDEEEDEEVDLRQRKNRVLADEENSNDAQDHDDDNVDDGNHQLQHNNDTSNNQLTMAEPAARTDAANGNGNETSTSQHEGNGRSKHQIKTTNSSSSVIEIDKSKKVQLKTNRVVNSSNAVNSVQPKKSSGVYQFIEEKQKISLTRERRAARTLGIIMGEFCKRKLINSVQFSVVCANEKLGSFLLHCLS